MQVRHRFPIFAGTAPSVSIADAIKAECEDPAEQQLETQAFILGKLVEALHNRGLIFDTEVMEMLCGNWEVAE